MAKMCPKCGAVLKNESLAYCVACGSPVNTADPHPTVPVPPPVNVYPPAQPACAPRQTSYAPAQNTYVPPQNTYVPPQNTYAPQQSTYAPQQNTYAPPQTTYVPPQNTYAPQQNTYAPPQTTYVPPQNTYAPQQNTYAPAQPTYAPAQNAYTPQTGGYTATVPAKKAKTGLIVGLIIGVLVVAGVVTACIFIFGGSSGGSSGGILSGPEDAVRNFYQSHATGNYSLFRSSVSKASIDASGVGSSMESLFDTRCEVFAEEFGKGGSVSVRVTGKREIPLSDVEFNMGGQVDTQKYNITKAVELDVVVTVNGRHQITLNTIVVYENGSWKMLWDPFRG